MSYNEIAGSSILYIAVIVGLLIVAGISVIYLIKCYRHAVECGIEKQTLSKVVKSSAAFAIVPSIGIVAGLITLITVIGVPYSWFRLSVVGSMVYELMAANMAMTAVGVSDVSTATAETFALVMWGMCVPISLGNILNIFLCRKVHLGSMKLANNPDKGWSAASSSVFMNSLLLVMMVPYIFSGGINLATFLTSAVLGLVIAAIAGKLRLRWLGEFALAICLIGAISASVFYTNIF